MSSARRSSGRREAARELNHAPVPVFTYLANAIRVGDRQIRTRWSAASIFARCPSSSGVSRHVRSDEAGHAAGHPDLGEPLTNAVAGFDRVERVDRSRAEREAWRHRTAGLLSLGCRGRAENGFRTVHGRGNRSDGGARRRPPSCARVSRHHGSRKLLGLGSAVSDRPVARAAAGRSLLEGVSHDAEGVSGLRTGARSLGTRYGTLTGLRFAVPPGRIRRRWRTRCGNSCSSG